MPSHRDRALAATAIATLTATWVGWGLIHIGNGRTDWDQLWFAARTMLAGHNPYPLVGPGKAFDWPWPLFYPPAGALPALPFAWLPLRTARLCYVFAMAWVFAFLMARDGWYRLVACMSGAYLSAFSLVQWSPIVACAILAPRVFGWVAPGKPTLGIEVCASASTRRDLVWLLGWFVGLTLLIAPWWLWDWRQAVSTATNARPYLLRPGGFLLLLALLRWRRPEARFLAAMAIVPGTSGSADGLMLAAFPHSFRQGLVLAILTHLVNFYLATRPPAATFDATIARSSGATLWLVLVPALIVVLMRPNRVVIAIGTPRGRS